MSTSADIDLVERVAAGSVEAAESFIDRFGSYVLAVVRSVCNDEDVVEDVVQRFFLHVLENDAQRLRKWRRGGSLAAYLGTVARRVTIDHLRWLGRDPHVNPDEDTVDPPDPDPDPEGLAAMHERAEQLERAMAQLRGRDRDLLERRLASVAS